MKELLLAPEAVTVPRINNNDDDVKLIYLAVDVGSQVKKGQTLAHVETDKAVVDIEAEVDGYVLHVSGNLNENIKVGSVLMWVGGTPDMAVPFESVVTVTSGSSMPTAKAKVLLQSLGLDSAEIPASGSRLTVDDVNAYVLNKSLVRQTSQLPTCPIVIPEVAGVLQPLKNQDRGMLSTVLWHRDVAVPGYVELSYDISLWEKFATDFGKKHELFLNPILPLMAHQLAQIACAYPRINATISGAERYEYSVVNVGFTIQVEDSLYLAVLRNAATLDAHDFVNSMIDLQRKASRHQLGILETTGATLGFTSMARWKISRHIPVLAPQTALMVAHSVGNDGVGCLGATYDHRVNNGSEVAKLLKKLSKPGFIV